MTEVSKSVRRLLLRPYQQDARDAFHDGLRRQILIWHRRAGKDIDTLDFAAEEAAENVGTYWHLYPTHVQAKRAIWNGVDAQTGERFLERAFPSAERASTRQQDLQIEMNNGSMWQLCGSDRYDSLVGSDVRGVSFSEWALCDPRAWDYIRPIIRVNKGWVRFITTYRGRNHAYRMAKRLARNPEWYVDIRTIEDTSDCDGNRILTDADMQAEREEGMSDALIRQEYYCDPVAAAEGSVYGRELEKLLEAGRMSPIAYDSSKPVFASWSLKWDNEYTVIFWQRIGNVSNCIGSKSFKFWSLSDSLDYVANHYPWKYISRHIIGNDIPASVGDFFETRGQNIDQAPETKTLVKTAREMLATTYIDNARRPWDAQAEDENNNLLIDALNGFAFAKNAKRSEYTNTPANTWEKHFAAAFETYAIWADGEPNTLGGWYPRASTAINDQAVI